MEQNRDADPPGCSAHRASSVCVEEKQPYSYISRDHIIASAVLTDSV